MNTNGNGNGHSNGNGHGSSWWSSMFGGGGSRAASDAYLEPYRRIALQLHYNLPRPDNSRSALLVTPKASTLGAHGSTALACCFAEELRRPVLLIDACPRDPAVSRMLNCVENPGFADILADPKLSLDDLVLPTTFENVSFLPAGDYYGSQAAPPRLVNALLKSAERNYDFVLISANSVLNDSISLSLAPHVGCVLLLVVENQTMVEDLDAAQDALSFCNAHNVGMVLTTPINRSRSFYNGNGTAYQEIDDDDLTPRTE